MLPDGNALRLTGGLTVGRDVPETRDALIHFDGVSRIHCWLVQKSDTIFIVDLGSKNGTWYRGERLLAHALHHFSLSALPIYMRLGHSAQLEIIGDHSA
jgi:pSer/pThr/pTyr-binding forkhead associated (FHA) protein